ncbi:bacteriorhodopsin [Microlunatus flavus]|uniref:Bacteriorhodopsin n=1 Tax=Microlunatus flavus TaxID=1036181 RepID=A0A1H9ANM8_9ACTN|nr:bacteriorhodopsin [Microlunatus flavus]SEP78300.1 Bacteriorhodopsin [Microlunatus flavus]
MESRLTYTEAQWDVVLAGFVLAFFLLLGLSVYLLASRRELSARYRPSSDAGAVIGLVACLSYVLLVAAWVSGFDYDPERATFSPSSSTLQFRNSYRYVDWMMTVPLLTLELLAVTTLTGLRARRTRATWMALGFLMILTGYLGAAVYEGRLGHLVWGLVSTAFFVPLYVGLLRTGLREARRLGEPAGEHLRGATLMLSWTWGVYPLAYCVPFFFADSTRWAVGRQLAFDVADVCAKVAFGLYVHSCAKARTAVDVARGESAHPEPVYVSTEKVAEAQPVLPGDRSVGAYGHPGDVREGETHVAPGPHEHRGEAPPAATGRD